jgi:hypothetical protein
MRGTWIGLVLGAFMITGSSFARADEVGCCIADCLISGVGRRMTRTDMTQAECEGSFGDCERTWRSEGCAAHPQVRELHMNPGVPVLSPEEEARTPADGE